MIRHESLLPQLAIVLTALAACADEATCSEGEVLMSGACVAEQPGDDAQPSDAPSEDEAPDAGMQASGRPGADEGFGDPCTDDVNHSECTDTADFCALMPGAAEGICTAQGCVEDETVCPEGWSCFDLSAFMEGLPSICTEP